MKNYKERTSLPSEILIAFMPFDAKSFLIKEYNNAKRKLLPSTTLNTFMFLACITGVMSTEMAFQITLLKEGFSTLLELRLHL